MRPATSRCCLGAVHRSSPGYLPRVEAIHLQDSANGFGRVALPPALARKYPHPHRQWRRQFVFPQGHRWLNATTEAAAACAVPRHPAPTGRAISGTVEEIEAHVHVETNGKQFVEAGNPRSRAAWGGIDRLCGLGLLQKRGHKREVFRITADGYRIADAIKVETGG